jgi:hypothetical protein
MSSMFFGSLAVSLESVILLKTGPAVLGAAGGSARFSTSLARCGYNAEQALPLQKMQSVLDDFAANPLPPYFAALLNCKGFVFSSGENSFRRPCG